MLGLVVAAHVVAEHPELAEGSFSKVRAAVVSEPTLAEVATEIELGVDLRLGKGEASSGGREKPSILSDAMEAVIAAVYLDGGLDAARDLVLGLLAGRIAAEVAEGPGGADHKTQLQILVAQRTTSTPAYVVSDEGPDHAKRFRAEVHVDGRCVGVGHGRSKKHAEQSAAGAALAVLEGVDAVVPTAASTTISESEQGHA